MKSIAIILFFAWTTVVFIEGASLGKCTTSDDCPQSYICTNGKGNAPVKRCIFQSASSATKIVAFKASVVSNLTPIVDETLVFQEIILNVGDNYDNETGMFTAPCSGLYFLTAQMGTPAGSRVAAAIMVEDKEYGRVYTRDTDTYAMTSSDAVATMVEGERAYVKIIALSGSLWQSQKVMISFSGFLVHEM